LVPPISTAPITDFSWGKDVTMGSLFPLEDGAFKGRKVNFDTRGVIRL
jgi:hypothetical protein